MDIEQGAIQPRQSHRLSDVQWIMSAEDGRLIPNRWALPGKTMLAGMLVEKPWISAQNSLDSRAT